MMRSILNRVSKFSRSKSHKGKQGPGKASALSVEALESRELLSVTSVITSTALSNTNLLTTGIARVPPAAGLAIINTLVDPTVRNAALADFDRDFGLTRNDMLDIFSKATAGYASITATQVLDLETLVDNGPTLGMPQYVENLAYKVVWDSIAPAYVAGQELSPVIVSQAPIGKPTAGRTSPNPYLQANENAAAVSILQQVDNWFLGELLPNDSLTENGKTVTPTYQKVNLPLFSGATPSYTDVAQGDLGDCWLMASLAEVAALQPNAIENMFTNNGDGTYTVRFFISESQADYVTVNTYLPGGGSVYDHPQTDLWAALAEKAYVQENASGLIGSRAKGVDSYQALNNGSPTWALPAITCIATSSNGISPLNLIFGGASVLGAAITSAWPLSYVVLCTGSSPGSSSVVPNHCYALVGISNGEFTLYNPWGVNGGTSADNGKYYPGYVTLNATGIISNFVAWDNAGASTVLAKSATPFVLGTTQIDNSGNPLFSGLQKDQGFLDNTMPFELGNAMLVSLADNHHQNGSLASKCLDAALVSLFDEDNNGNLGLVA